MSGRDGARAAPSVAELSLLPVWSRLRARGRDRRRRGQETSERYARSAAGAGVLGLRPERAVGAGRTGSKSQHVLANANFCMRHGVHRRQLELHVGAASKLALRTGTGQRPDDRGGCRHAGSQEQHAGQQGQHGGPFGLLFPFVVTPVAVRDHAGGPGPVIHGVYARVRSR